MTRGLLVGLLTGLLGLASASTAALSFAGDANIKTIEALYASKEKLKGQRVAVRGKVVKVNAGIMGRNFFHIQDGSGNAGGDLTVTTQEEVEVGSEVVVTGLVTVDRNFGAGYSYPLILEEATVAKVGQR